MSEKQPKPLSEGELQGRLKNSSRGEVFKGVVTDGQSAIEITVTEILPAEPVRVPVSFSERIKHLGLPIGSSMEEVFKKEQARERLVVVAHELFKSGTVFPFSGIDDDALLRLQEADKEAPPGYITPIEDIVERMKNEGIKIFLGKPERNDTANVLVIPAKSTDPISDSVLAKNLRIVETGDRRLRELIMLSKI